VLLECLSNAFFFPLDLLNSQSAFMLRFFDGQAQIPDLGFSFLEEAKLLLGAWLTRDEHAAVEALVSG